MNNAQQIFLLFFAIFWGTAANAWPKRKPFHWPLVSHRPVLRRLLLSVTLLNIVPIAYFAWMLGLFQKHEDSVVIAILPAFSVFGFYRIWIGLTECVPGLFYYSAQELPTEIKNTEPSFEVNPRSTWKLNLLFGFLYVAIGTLPAFLVTNR